MTTPVTPNHPRPDARKLLQAPRRVEFAAQPKPALPVYPPMKAAASASPAPSAIPIPAPMPKPTFADAPAECSRGLKRTASLSELRDSDREKLNALLKSREPETPTSSPASSPIPSESTLRDMVVILDLNLESTQLSVLDMEKEVKVLQGTVDELDRRTIDDHNYITRVDEEQEKLTKRVDTAIAGLEKSVDMINDRDHADYQTRIEDRKKMMNQIEEFGKKIVDITRTEEAANNLSLASLKSKMEVLERNNNLLAARVANLETQLNFEQMQRQTMLMHAVLRPPQQPPAFFAPPNGYMMCATDSPLVMPKTQ